MDFLKGAMERVKPEVKRLIRRELDKMTETNANIHVLADETLGGIKREYVEVDRKAEVGERIILRDDDEIGTFLGSNSSFVYLDLGGYRNGVACDPACCRVLEPTDIVHIDGQRYEMVEREAEVGEKVIHLYEGESNGIAREVRKTDDEGVEVDPYEDEEGVWIGFSHGYYLVLVPVEAAEEEPQPADPIDVIASLAQEVASLKRTVDRHRDEIDTLYKDKRTLGEELARLAAEIGKETESSAKAMAEAFVALKRAGL
ncbi:hypothetical protein [Bacillus velezensis]|uniref:hypothetical protein n=1 Tax=Bacillus velezensis TaxID=492670 RepID=UPI000C14DAB4